MNHSPKVRVLQVISSSTTSGAEHHVLSLTHRLAQRGHEVEVITPGPGWLTDSLSGVGVTVRQSPMKGTGWLRSIGFMAREVRRRRVDVVHTHLTRSAYLGYAVGLLTRVPVVTSVHIANNDRIYRRLARGRNRLVAVSNYVAGMLHGHGVPQSYIDTVYNGTDFVAYEPIPREETLRELGIPERRRVIGIVAKVCRDKGQVELLQSMRHLRKEHPETHVLMVGKIEAGYEPDVRAALYESGMEGRATLTGVRHDIPRLLDAMTLTTLPSAMETFGVAAIEAMARGRAVVASKAGALPEVVRHGQTGLIVDLRPEAIADAIGYLLENEPERERMGRNGRALVERKFTVEEMANRFEAVYQRAIA